MAALLAPAASLSFGFAALAATAPVIVIGVAAEGLAAVESWLRGSSSGPGEEYQFGNAFGESVLDSLLAVGIAAGGEIIDLVNWASLMFTGYEVKEGLRDLVCDTPPCGVLRGDCGGAVGGQ